MPLQCQVFVSPSSQSGDQPVMVAITATNPSTTTPIVVTGGSVSARQLGDGPALSCTLPILPLGPGMNTVVAAGATILIGPMPLVVYNGAANNSYQNPVANSGSQPSASWGGPTSNRYPQFTTIIGATLYGSDGSINQAGTAPVLIDVVSPPPLGYQGGFLHFSAPNNLITGLLAGVL